ncbi:MAG: hypothetical protein VBE63_23510 [Lamprobacter sp.]|uniref:hypothetical protein n=1 Tax=Lamprobacter sp. TaxID=3100796 RepID=UPI002B2624A0|nr:hypothetical protein [Lamprobacter sp.]MEA3642884.1 hypothetical protein [Lamprobacter sp.]
MRLSRQLRFYAKEDDPPRRVKPVPISVVASVVRHAYSDQELDPATQATADMTCLGFFFLCRPGEHTLTTDNTPFTLRDVTLYRDKAEYTYQNCPPEEYDNATSVALTFTTQKNGVKNEIIRNGSTGDPLVCPVRTAARLLAYHHSHNSPPDTPLCAFYDNDLLCHVRAKHITQALRSELTLLLANGMRLNILPHEIDARSLRSGGATAMLCAKIDKDLTQLQGRWKSDAMIRYLHISAAPIVNSFARKMFKAGNFSFFPQLYDHYDGYAYTFDDPDPTDIAATTAPADLSQHHPPLLIHTPPSSDSDSADDASAQASHASPTSHAASISAADTHTRQSSQSRLSTSFASQDDPNDSSWHPSDSDS